jgi:RNA polymerase sigma-70 factor (ECF subfamily)
LAKEQAVARKDFSPADPAPQAWIDFTEVVNNHWTAVYRVVYTLTGNIHDTEDLTQETFLRALNRLDSFEPGTRMRAWLLRIATNAFFDVQRKRQRVNHEALPADVPGKAVPPGRSLETREQSELLRKALTELSETGRLVFHLRATEELSFREIAEIIGTSEEAARWHMHQARTKLLDRLAEHTSERGA